jgi:hypothetical protein
MYLRLALILFLAFTAVNASAQFWKKKKDKGEAEISMRQPTSLDPTSSHKEYAPKSSKKASKGPTYGAEKEFYDRMASVEKEREKEERIMEKPQYSNPMYFGHKHPPKKRKPSKMKYCKVCGIRH